MNQLAIFHVIKMDQYGENFDYIYRQKFQINVTITAYMNINCYIIFKKKYESNITGKTYNMLINFIVKENILICAIFLSI